MVRRGLAAPRGARDPDAWRELVVGGRVGSLRDALRAELLDIRALPAPRWFLTLERSMTASPAPVTTAWGDGLTPFDGFHLARLGVRQLLPRRPASTEVAHVLHRAMAIEPLLDPHVRSLVGHVSLTEVLERVRNLFLDQALGLMRDDRSKSARLLGVSRQAVQRMIRRRAGSPADARREEPATSSR